MMPLKNILKNKLLLSKHYHVNESSIDEWPYWLFEENIKIVNELADEEEKTRKKDEDKQQQQMPNFNPGSYMSNVSNMANKFKSK
jgi:hypothetical protein